MQSNVVCNVFTNFFCMEILEPSIMRFFLWKIGQWCRVKLADFMRYSIPGADKATLNDIKILHHSSNFVVVDKSFDVLINSDDSNDKVLQNQ